MVYGRKSSEPRGVNQRNERIETMRRLLSGIAASVLWLGCSTTGNLGIVTKNMADSASLLRSGRAYEELGPSEGEACRYFLLGVIPWGASDMETALNKAVGGKGGDALINVSVTTSLYGFFPIYNVFSLSCTTIKGVAVKFQSATSSGGPPGENPPQVLN
jgi:hypothetical protein